MRTVGKTFRASLAAATCLTAVTTAAMAQTATAPATPAAAPAPPAGYWIWNDTIHLSAVVEGGIIANPAAPKLNGGHLFTDRANQPSLNQILIGAEKKLDPKATGYDWGFKLSAMYGSDARYTHYLGFLDQAVPKDQRNQLDVVEASFSIHFPSTVFAGGLDVKAGLFATPLGAELIDPSTNPFYSHSYIFNFAAPLKHTGVLATLHATSIVDLYLGLDTGTNTTFGNQGDNNNSIAGIIGFGLNLMEGNLTVLALSHIGPENATRALGPQPVGGTSPFPPGVGPFNANNYMRMYNDVVVVWKYNDKLTLTTEATWARDEFGNNAFKGGKPADANAFGIAQYAAYTLTDTLTLNGRVEIFRDDNGFFVGGFPGNYDPVYAQKGVQFPQNGTYNPPQATYGAITVGLTYKPEVPKPITGLMIRPEVRYDQALGGTKVFNRNSATGTFRDSGAFTFGADVVVTF